MDGWIVIKTIIDNKKFNLDYKKLKTQIKDMGKSIETFLKNGFKIGLSGAKGILSIIGVITKAILKIGLTIAGITVGIALLISGALILSKAFEEVFDKNEQIKANLDYMKFALIKALEPAIKAVANVLVKIIDFLAKIMQYTAYIIYAWTGYNIFEKATPEAYAKYFEEAQENSKKTAKNAKEIKKQLAGFDEMNILHDTSQNNKDESNGYFAPNIDFSKINEFKPPKWLEWIKNNGELIKNIIIAIGVAFAGWKLAKLVSDLVGITGSLGLLGQIGIVAVGVELLYTALTGRELISDISEIIKGLKDLEKIRKQQSEQAKKAQKDTESLIKTYHEVADSTGVTKEQTEQYINTLINGIKTNNELIESMEKQKSWLGALNGDNKKITNSQNEYNKVIDIQVAELRDLYNEGKLNSDQTKQYTELLKKQIDKTMEASGKLAVNSKEYENNRTKVNELKGELEKITGKKYDIQSSFAKPDTSRFEKGIKNVINSISSFFSNLNPFGTGFFSGFGFAKGGIVVPKLARGGIINMPNRGVPLTNAIGGESGKEGVIPLTDSQQMALLGEAIGKYITINATIVNSMNGRVLNRELQKIQNQSNFATNGR